MLGGECRFLLYSWTASFRSWPLLPRFTVELPDGLPSTLLFAIDLPFVFEREVHLPVWAKWTAHLDLLAAPAASIASISLRRYRTKRPSRIAVNTPARSRRLRVSIEQLQRSARRGRSRRTLVLFGYALCMPVMILRENWIP